MTGGARLDGIFASDVAGSRGGSSAVRLCFLDAGTLLEVRDESTKSDRGESTDYVTTTGDYRQVAGVTLPYRIETRSKQVLGGGAIRMEGSMLIAIDKIEINVDIPANRFARAKPEPGKGP